MAEAVFGIGRLEAEDPAQVGPYRLIGRLGAGGMGRVYLGLTPGARPVAVKAIHPEYAADPDFRVRFMLEVRAARAVQGAFTAPVVDAEPESESPWLAVRYVPSLTLYETVARFGPLAEPAVRSLGAALAEALAAIHAAGIVHRDLKPGNVLITGSGPLVIDFGIARALDGTRVTRTGSTPGTAGYTPPEQLTGRPSAGTAGDVFALGGLLVFAASGRGPFGEGDSLQISRRVVRETPLLDGVPEPLRPVIAACLGKEPGERPDTATLMRAFAPADVGTILSAPLREALRQRTETVETLVRQPPQVTGTSDVHFAPIPRDLVPPDVSGRKEIGRRKLLAWTGGVAGAAAVAGGVTGLVMSLGGSGNGKPSAAAATAAALPKPFSKAAWSVRPTSSVLAGTLALVGDTVAIVGQGGVIGLSAATGKTLWYWDLASQQAWRPQLTGVTVNNPCGVLGSAIYGFGLSNTLEYVLFGMDGTGKVTSSLPVAISGIGYSLCDASLNTALFTHYGSTGVDSVVAVDTQSGLTRWTGKLQNQVTERAYTSTFVTADNSNCYIQDGPDTYALTLAGKSLWHSAGTAESALPTNLVLANGVLLVGSMQVTALDPKTGRQIWASPVNWQPGAKGIGSEQNYAGEMLLSAYAGLLSAVGDTVYFSNGSGEVWALEISTGALKWKYSYDDLYVNQAGDFMASNVFATEHLVVVPYQDTSGANAAAPVNGFVALDPASGSLLGKYPLPTDGYTGWQLIVSGKNVYGTDGTSVCAFEGGAG